ncbi:MAG: hypothetical protein CMJ75_06650 [Planctomycetaceae bacterium]|nr:hypothetical protein [Planctomycetaceae bacterium]
MIGDGLGFETLERSPGTQNVTVPQLKQGWFARTCARAKKLARAMRVKSHVSLKTNSARWSIRAERCQPDAMAIEIVSLLGTRASDEAQLLRAFPASVGVDM